MTLPLERLGDKGQRFVLELKDYPEEGWQEVLYTNDKDRAWKAALSMSKAPTCTDWRILDREGLDDE